jgi:zinc transport system permease protein
LIILLTFRIAKKLILGVISEELAKSAGVAIAKQNLVYLLLVGTVVAMGIKFIGTLLMGALVIVPAAAAKNMAVSLRSYFWLSALFGVVSAVVGVVFASFFHLATGPVVVLTSVFIFIFSFFFRKTAKTC